MQDIRVNAEEFKRRRKHEQLKQRLTNALKHYCLPLAIEGSFLPRKREISRAKNNKFQSRYFFSTYLKE